MFMHKSFEFTANSIHYQNYAIKIIGKI